MFFSSAGRQEVLKDELTRLKAGSCHVFVVALQRHLTRIVSNQTSGNKHSVVFLEAHIKCITAFNMQLDDRRFWNGRLHLPTIHLWIISQNYPKSLCLCFLPFLCGGQPLISQLWATGHFLLHSIGGHWGPTWVGRKFIWQYKKFSHSHRLTNTWYPKQPSFNGCFSWMIPNLYIKRWLFHQTSGKKRLFRVPGRYLDPNAW